MKEIFELMNQNKKLNEELQEVEYDSTKMIEKSLTEKFNLLSKILFPYKEIMAEMDIQSKVIILRSEQLSRNIKIMIDIRNKFWLQIAFNSDIYCYLMPSHIEQTYWVKYPVLQEIKIEKVVDEFKRGISFEIKTRNKNIATRINQIKTSLNLCNIETDIKIFEEMLKDLFELNNQYIDSKDKNLILLISNLITAMEKYSPFKEELYED